MAKFNAALDLVSDHNHTKLYIIPMIRFLIHYNIAGSLRIND